MHRTDAADNVNGQFTDGDPNISRAASAVDAAWLNDVQETVCNPIERAGITLAKGDGTQLYAAIVALARGSSLVQIGAARHGDAVTFPTPYVDAPLVVISGGVTYEPGTRWSTNGANGVTAGSSPTNTSQYEDVAPLNLTSAGFTVRARLKQKGSGTTTAESIGAPGTAATAPSTALNPAASSSTSASNATSPAPGISDSYTVTYSGSISTTNGDDASSYPDPIIYSRVEGTVTIAVDYSTDGSTWTEAANSRRTFDSGITKAAPGTVTPVAIPTTAITVTAPGMTAAGEFRIRVVSLTKTFDDSASDNGSVACSVALPTTGAVTYNYNSSTTDQYASKTPDAGDTVSWVAIGHI